MSGTMDRSAAKAAFERATPAFRACMAAIHWNNRFPEREGTVLLRFTRRDGRLVDAKVELVGLTAPRELSEIFLEYGFEPRECIRPFTVYRLPGSGEVAYTVRVELH